MVNKLWSEYIESIFVEYDLGVKFPLRCSARLDLFYHFLMSTKAGIKLQDFKIPKVKYVQLVELYIKLFQSFTL